MSGQVVKHDQGTFDSATRAVRRDSPVRSALLFPRQGQVRPRSEIYPPQTASGRTVILPVVSSAVLVPAVAVIIGGLLSYVVQNRKISGNIDTTEASSLWQESASIREDYREQIASLRENLRALESRVTVAESANAQLIAANVDLGRQLHECRDENDALRTENESLKRTIRKVASGADPDTA